MKAARLSSDPIFSMKRFPRNLLPRLAALTLAPLLLLQAVAAEETSIHPDDLAVLEEVLAEQDAVLKKLGQPTPRMKREVKPTGKLYQMEITSEGSGTFGSGAFLRVTTGDQGRITGISANGPWLPNPVFPLLAKLPELRSIRCDHNIVMATRRTDASYDASGLVHLADSKLEDLTIGHGFDDAGMMAIAKLKGLKSVKLVHAMGGSAESAKALIAHPSLESVTFNLGPEKTNGEVCKILATLPNIREIGFNETCMTYEGGLEHLKPLAGRLEKVTFDASLVLPGDIEKLEADHPGLKVPKPNLGGLFRSGMRQNQIKKCATPEALAYFEKLQAGQR